MRSAWESPQCQFDCVYIFLCMARLLTVKLNPKHRQNAELRHTARQSKSNASAKHAAGAADCRRIYKHDQ